MVGMSIREGVLWNEGELLQSASAYSGKEVSYYKRPLHARIMVGWLTQTPRDTSAPASCRALAMAHPNPCTWDWIQMWVLARSDPCSLFGPREKETPTHTWSSATPAMKAFFPARHARTRTV